MSDLPHGWSTFTLRDIGGTVGGKTPSKSKRSFWSSRDLHWASPKDMKSFRLTSSEDMISRSAVSEAGMRVLPKGSVLVVTRSGILAHTLPIAIADIETTINQDIKAVLPSTRVDPTYLAYLLRSRQKEILETCSKEGTTVASVQTDLLEQLPLPLAPLGEQKRIADKLNRLLAAVDTCKARIDAIPAILQSFQQSVLAAATSGELTKNWRSNQECRANHQELVRIPSSWKVLRIRDCVASMVGGASPARDDYSASGVLVLNKGDIKELGRVVVKDVPNRIPHSYAAVHPTRIARQGTLLLTLRDLSSKADFLGLMARYEGAEPALITQGMFIVQPTDRVIPEYFVLFSNAPSYRRAVKAGKIGATQVHLRNAQFLEIEIPVPPLAEQVEIVVRVKAAFDRLDALGRRMESTNRMIDALSVDLLGRAFRGLC